jgi:two-component system phosphate regulon response regulator PhoB
VKPLQEITLGSLRLNLERQECTSHRGEQKVRLHLSPTEFRLLRSLMNVGQGVLSREQLLEVLWGRDVHVLKRTVDAHVSRLRRKLAGSSHTIVTAYGAGYQLRECKPQKS